jgi:hypothetical protein
MVVVHCSFGFKVFADRGVLAGEASFAASDIAGEAFFAASDAEGELACVVRVWGRGDDTEASPSPFTTSDLGFNKHGAKTMRFQLWQIESVQSPNIFMKVGRLVLHFYYLSDLPP